MRIRFEKALNEGSERLFNRTGRAQRGLASQRFELLLNEFNAKVNGEKVERL
jgi:hypothetical protein